MGLVDQAVPLRILENTARMVTLEAPRQKKLSFMPHRMAHTRARHPSMAAE